MAGLGRFYLYKTSVEVAYDLSVRESDPVKRFNVFYHSIGSVAHKLSGIGLPYTHMIEPWVKENNLPIETKQVIMDAHLAAHEELKKEIYKDLNAYLDRMHTFRWATGVFKRRAGVYKMTDFPPRQRHEKVNYREQDTRSSFGSNALNDWELEQVISVTLGSWHGVAKTLSNGKVETCGIQCSLVDDYDEYTTGSVHTCQYANSCNCLRDSTSTAKTTRVNVKRYNLEFYRC